MNNELKQDMEKLTKLVFELSEKYGITVIAHSSGYSMGMCTYGDDLKGITYYGRTKQFMHSEGKSNAEVSEKTA